jgi:Predicted metal-binding protein (DUF2103)
MPIKTKMNDKLTRSHTTMTDATARILSVIQKHPDVTKISLGEIRHVSGGRRDIKCLRIDAGIKVAIRGNGAVQQIYVYTNNADEVIAVLEKVF